MYFSVMYPVLLWFVVIQTDCLVCNICEHAEVAESASSIILNQVEKALGGSNTACKDDLDSVTTETCASDQKCLKLDFYATVIINSGILAGAEVNVHTFRRDCYSEVTTTGCADAAFLVMQVERDLEERLAASVGGTWHLTIYNVTGDACICDSDACNDAPVAVRGFLLPAILCTMPVFMRWLT